VSTLRELIDDLADRRMEVVLSLCDPEVEEEFRIASLAAIPALVSKYDELDALADDWDGRGEPSAGACAAELRAVIGQAGGA